MITPGQELVLRHCSATQGQCRPLLSALSEGRLCWVLTSMSKRLEGRVVTAPVPVRSLGLHVSLLWTLFYQRLSRGPASLMVAPGGADTLKRSAAVSWPHLSVWSAAFAVRAGA